MGNDNKKLSFDMTLSVYEVRNSSEDGSGDASSLRNSTL